MARMDAKSGQLVSFGPEFQVEVSTGPDGAELWSREVTFDAVESPGQFSRIASIGASVTDRTISVDTRVPAAITQIRLFGARSGSPSGDGLLVDELIVARLDQAQRRSYLTDCSEGAPQLLLDTGGTFVRATVGSGPADTLAQVFLGRAVPVWAPSTPFPTFNSDDVLLSAVSDRRDTLHEITVVDRRDDGWTDNPRLGPGMPIGFVALVWDSDGAWDFTWTRLGPMPATPDLSPPPPERIKTKDRLVELRLTKMVCLDDSDDLSDGEAAFDVTMRPSVGSPETRSFSWNPMESGSELLISERFTVQGAAATAPTLSVRGTEDDSDSAFGDEDDVADSTDFRPRIREGTWGRVVHHACDFGGWAGRGRLSLPGALLR